MLMLHNASPLYHILLNVFFMWNITNVHFDYTCFIRVPVVGRKHMLFSLYECIWKSVILQTVLMLVTLSSVFYLLGVLYISPVPHKVCSRYGRKGQWSLCLLFKSKPCLNRIELQINVAGFICLIFFYFMYRFIYFLKACFIVMF